MIPPTIYISSINNIPCIRLFVKSLTVKKRIRKYQPDIKPEYVSSTFASFLEANGLRRIRFHDLRHSCASLMLSSGVPMKQIQEWLGHSDISTTSKILLTIFRYN